MAVAVKNSPSVSVNPLDRLAFASLAGAAYVLGSLGIVFLMLPALWRMFWVDTLGLSAVSFGGATLQGVVMLLGALVLIALGGVLASPRSVPHGTRAGVFAVLVGLLLILGLTRFVSMWVEHWSFEQGLFSPTAGAVIVVAVGLALLAVGLRLLVNPAAEKMLVQFEDQGWFAATSYKPQQGQRVRRGTILGILLIAGAGIYTLSTHGVLKRGDENLELNIPFTGKVLVTDAGDAGSVLKPSTDGDVVLDRYDFQRIVQEYSPATHVKVINAGGSKFKDLEVVSKSSFDAERKSLEDSGTAPTAVPSVAPTGLTYFRRLILLPSVQFTVPLLLLVASIWIAWRVVNFPIFADFLIATEAEINKVSWTTRKRLVQDTIVVLATVILMSAFLFGTDRLWQVLLSSSVMKVLQLPEQQQQTNDRDRPLW